MPPESDLTPPVIEFRDVSLSFDQKPALTNVTFELRRGQMILVTGASESGKSVLLMLAAGLLRPDRGQILIEGREIQDIDESALLQIRARSMGIVFQDQSLFTGMSVFDNAYRLDERGWREERIEPAVIETLKFVGLQHDLSKLPEELSIGMRRRLEFARAMVGWPPIMLFDEPTAGLDPINARMILDLIVRARKEHGISSLYVTKEMHEIPYLDARWAKSDGTGNAEIVGGSVAASETQTKLLLLDRGKICFLGSVAEFESSDMPAVTLMTRPEPGAPFGTSYVADPWSRKRNKKLP